MLHQRVHGSARDRNSVTLLEDVFVPEENRIAREGDGLKIALTTLNTGRLALMAIAVSASKWATKVAREWATERVQWGRPIGKHDAVAQKLAFIAGSAFGLEAMLDVSARLADDKRNDIRIEAALCQGVRLGARVEGDRRADAGPRRSRLRDRRVADGPRREARARRAGHAGHAREPHLRGSSEIMHLLIAREAVDTAPPRRRRPADGRRRRQGTRRTPR